MMMIMMMFCGSRERFGAGFGVADLQSAASCLGLRMSAAHLLVFPFERSSGSQVLGHHVLSHLSVAGVVVIGSQSDSICIHDREIQSKLELYLNSSCSPKLGHTC